MPLFLFPPATLSSVVLVKLFATIVRHSARWSFSSAVAAAFAPLKTCSGVRVSASVLAAFFCSKPCRVVEEARRFPRMLLSVWDRAVGWAGSDWGVLVADAGMREARMVLVFL